MGANRHLLRCNGYRDAVRGRRRGGADAGQAAHDLKTYGPDRTVRLILSDLTEPLLLNPPSVVVDFLELAALVYAADQCCSRHPGARRIDYGDKWHREFRFDVAVREPAFWRRKAVQDALCETLTFLSDDDYEFRFAKMADPPAMQNYLEFADRGPRRPTSAGRPVEQVMLMSGGLDSLVGAAEQVLKHGRRVAMVSHKPVGHMAARQQELIDMVAGRATRPSVAPLRVPVTANMIGVADPDPTQRSRSFLYAALGAVVADACGLDAVSFYENGIVSVNLPLCGQELGGRATRTTHPRVLHGFGTICSLLFGRPFAVRNEYLWDTKQDVLERLKALSHSDLARTSVSCIHTRGTTQHAPHCGMCSQCLSRWVAALGAAYGPDDPADGYREPVLTGPRTTDTDRILAERFIGQARNVARMTDAEQFNQAYALELARVYPYLNMPTPVAAARLFELHHRHARQVGDAVVGELRSHAEDHWGGRLARDCALSYAFGAGGNANDVSGPPADRARPDGFYYPRTLVFRGRAHTCDLTPKERAFLDVGLKDAEVDVHTLMHPTDGIVFKERYVSDAKHRNKISQFLSRMGARLIDATPPLGVQFALPRGVDYVVRRDPPPLPVDDSSMTRK